MAVGIPTTMQRFAHYSDIAAELTAELMTQRDLAVAAGIAPGAIALDPGIGFAKGPGQNEALLGRLAVLLNLGCRLVVGVSRKGFIGRLSGETEVATVCPGRWLPRCWRCMAVRQSCACMTSPRRCKPCECGTGSPCAISRWIANTWYSIC